MKLFLASAERTRTAVHMRPAHRMLVAALAVAVTVSALTVPAAHAAPPAGDGWVVSVGDSLYFGRGGPLGRQFE
jgi:hypothetical protein